MKDTRPGSLEAMTLGEQPSRRLFLRRSGLLAAASLTPWVLQPLVGNEAQAAPSLSAPIGGEPWNGLTVLKVTGDGAWSTQMTRYTLSIVDVDPLTAAGNQTDWQRDGRSSFTLRFEWNSTDPNTNSRATGAWIYLVYPNGGGKLGPTEWAVTMNEAASGVATKTIHLDSDPMNGTIDVPAAPGPIEMYLYVEKAVAGAIRWSADSRGGAWGQYPKPTSYARGLLWSLAPGCMVGYHLGSDPHGTCDNQWSPDGEFCQTDYMGKRCAAVRIYSNVWEKPNSAVDRTIADGKLPMWSVKPPSGGWQAVANGTASNPWLTEIVDAMKSYNKEFIFIFHHEPHDDANNSTNTAATYRSAVLRIKDTLLQRGAHHSVGGNVFFAYAPTLWDAKKGTPIGSGDTFYPGDGVFDIFAPTSYNWYNWNIGDGTWYSFQDVMVDAVSLCRKRGQKLFPSETGSHPSADGHDRNQWLRDAQNYAHNNNDARSVMVGFIYFHVQFEDAGEWHDWTLYNPDGSQGYTGGFAKDPWFQATPFSLK